MVALRARRLLPLLLMVFLVVQTSWVPLVYSWTQFFPWPLTPLGGGRCSKGPLCRAASCPKESSKDSNQRTSHWLPALTGIGMPEKSLETHRRRALGPN